MTMLEMPKQVYSEDRRIAFESLARSCGARPLTLRVALSNVFVSMARQGRARG